MLVAIPSVPLRSLIDLTRPLGRCAALVAGLWASAGAVAQGPANNLLGPLLLASGGSLRLNPAWAPGNLPAQTLPLTRFEAVMAGGQAALRVDTQAGYGNLVHPLPGASARARLSWRWRMDELNAQADLTRREADDTSLKLCLLFDMPIERVPFLERQLLRLARNRSAQPLPAATLCYVWDARLPVGTAIDNAYSRRVRYLVLRSGAGPGAAPLQQWLTEQRDVAADFAAAFGDESPQLPPLQAVALGADADNTRGRSLAHVADVSLVPVP